MPYADAHAAARGARIYYEVHGDGEPLLMIPGFGSNATVYWANAPAVAERFRTIALDPRGAGRSSVPADPGSYTMEVLAADAAAVLDAAGVESAHVFGTSMGGMVAQHVALEHPHRVRRLVLACTTPGGSHHVMPDAETIVKFMAAGSIADPVAAARSTFPLHYTDAYLAAHDGDLVGRALTNQALRASPEGLAGHSAAAGAHDTYERLPEIAAPTLVLHGEHDPLVRVENGRALAARIPDARMITYPARHIFFSECAEEVNADIIRFLTATEEELAA